MKNSLCIYKILVPKSIMFFVFLVSAVQSAELPSFLQLWNDDNTAKNVTTCSYIYKENGELVEGKRECESKTYYFFYDAKPGKFEEEWQQSEYYRMDNTLNGLLNEDGLLAMCDENFLDTMRTVFGIKTVQKDFKVTEEQKRTFKKNQDKRSIDSKRDFRDRMVALISFCENPNKSTYKEVARTDYNVNERTCYMTSKTVTEIYSKVNDNLWVYQSEPSWGPCRRVLISTFRLPQGKDHYSDWELELRSISQDKLAKPHLSDFTCGEVDENSTELYTSRSDPVELGCAYFH